MRRACRRSGRQGFALLIVLWALVLLTELATALLSGARGASQIAFYRRAAAQAVAADDAAISMAIFDLLRNNPSLALERKVGAARVSIRLENLSGRINPNFASSAMLQAALLSAGALPQTAPALAAAIIDWRSPGLVPSLHGAKANEYKRAGLAYGPPGRPFEHLGELRHVLGMKPELLADLLPHLTLWTTSDPDPAFADAIVLAALRAGGAAPVARQMNGPQVIAITALAALPGAQGVQRRAVIRFGYSPDGRAWRVLAWDDGAGEPG